MVTLIFISAHGLANLYAKEGKSGSIYLAKMSRANVRAFHENADRICTEITFVNPLFTIHKKVVGFCRFG